MKMHQQRRQTEEAELDPQPQLWPGQESGCEIIYVFTDLFLFQVAWLKVTEFQIFK